MKVRSVLVLTLFALALVGSFALFYTLRVVDLLTYSVIFLIFFFIVAILFRFFNRYFERRTLNEVKNEITWEKQKVIREEESILTRIFVSNYTLAMLLFLFFSAALLLLFSGKEVDSFNFSQFITSNPQYPLTPLTQKNLIDENSEIVTGEKKFSAALEENSSISAIYYTGYIPLDDLKEILDEEKAKLERILNVKLERVTINLDPEREICRKEDAVACYYNGKIFLVPKNMMSKEYARRIIRHELIHHAEEEIANKYEMNEMEFSGV